MLSLSCIREYLNENPDNTALFIDAEYTYDPAWAAKQGVDTSRVMVIKTNDAKMIFEGLLGKVKVNKATKKVSKGMRGILDHVIEGTDPRFKNLGIIVLDSIAVLNTPLEIRAEVGKANMAPIPRFLSTELKKLTPVIAHANIAFIGINQVRVDLGKMFGDPTSSPGGRALKHACSLMINMAPNFSSDSVIANEDGERIGHTVRAKVEKNKVGTPFSKAEYKIEYQKGVVQKDREVFDLAIKYGLITRPSSQSYEIGGKKVRGADAAFEFLTKEHPDLIEEYASSIREAYLGEGDSETSVENGIENVEEENPLIARLK